jgi:hypothetical protein
MSHLSGDDPVGPTSYPDLRPSPWLGWIGFAAVLMVLLGALHMFEGLVALFKDEYFLVRPGGLTVNIDYTAWGWAHLIGGAVVLAAGIGVTSGQVWARTVGVIVAMVSIIGNVAFMAAYPFWSLTMIALAIVIILALTVHGAEVRGD